jgi:hypothetical protein
MAGVKGKSGRGSTVEEGIMKNNLKLGAVLLHQYLNDPNIPLEAKITKIIPLLAKLVPQEIKAEVSHEIFLSELIRKAANG